MRTELVRANAEENQSNYSQTILKAPSQLKAKLVTKFVSVWRDPKTCS